MRRNLTTFLVVALLGLIAAGPSTALAQSGGDSNAAQAENRESGSSVLDFAFAVRRVGGETVDQTNTATAYSSCETCQTVAIAIQVVLVTAADPSVINPTNVSVSVNETCTTCATFAAAYQFVVGTGGPVRFTAAGRRELQRVQRALAELRTRFERGELTVTDVKASVAALTDRVKRVLESELVPTGRRGRDRDDEADSNGRVRSTPELDDRGRPRGENPVPLPPGLEDSSPSQSPTTPSAPGQGSDGGQGEPTPGEPGDPPSSSTEPPTSGDGGTSPPSSTTTTP